MSMHKNIILIHLKDEAAKGVYRPLFERNFIQKLSAILKGLNHKSIRRKYQRIFIDLDSKSDIENIKKKLLSLNEINYFCFPEIASSKIEEIKKASLSSLLASNAKSFKPKIKISYKAFPFSSKKLTKDIGDYLIKKTDKTLDFIEPETIIYIEILENSSLIYNIIYKS